jgi:hypothetical protein
MSSTKTPPKSTTPRFFFVNKTPLPYAKDSLFPQDTKKKSTPSIIYTKKRPLLP